LLRNGQVTFSSHIFLDVTDVTASQGDAKGCWSQRGQRAARVQLQSRALDERTIDLGQVAACASLVRILYWYHQLEGLVEDHVPAVGFSKL
jgi:hypothetical protein